MNSDFIVWGTDTDVGKTTFALLWMAAFRDEFEYWKPVETGDSDCEAVKRLVPLATSHSPVAHFQKPLSPPLAARLEGRTAPQAAEITSCKPTPIEPGRGLLIESFGSLLSPLNEQELQVRLADLLQIPCVLVGSTRVGAIGRVLQSLASLEFHNIRPAAIVLVGPPDEHAVEQIREHARFDAVVSLVPPDRFDEDSIARAAREQRPFLTSIRQSLESQTQSMAIFETAELARRDRAVLWHPYSAMRDSGPVLPVVSGQDEFLVLTDGRRVIDGISSWWTVLHGHRHPVLMHALAQAARELDHVIFAGVTHAAAVELAELMLGTMPWSGGRVFFSDDGSTAVEVALKMAYQFWCHRGEPHRTMFVSFEGGYHGDTFGAMSVGRDPVFFGRFEPLLFRTEQVPVSAERLDDLLRRIAGQVAALIIEPLVQGACGMRMHSPDELRAIHRVARDHGVLFIADEVMTGGGRTGNLWAFQSADIAPDFVCAGKTIAGGVLPLAATLVAPQIVQAFDTDERSRMFFHGHSFTANPLACAVGVANWRMISRGVGPVPLQMEQFWRSRLAGLSDRRGVKDVRVRGTIAAVELDAAGGYFAEAGREMRRISIEHGVLLRPLGNVLYAMPPLCTSADSLDKIVLAMHAAVQAVC